jgi:hypothetical protein
MSLEGVLTRKLNDRQLAVVLVVAGLLIQLPALWFGMPGSKAINNALRILDGDVPYRDFWTMYAPGHFYLAAALFKVFGVHVWVQGVAAQLLIAVDAALLFAITRRLGLERRLALMVGFAFVLMHGNHKEVTSYETALVFLLLALDRVVSYVQGHGARHLVVAGMLCGVGAWFKHDVSFHVAFGAVAGLTLAWLVTSGRRPGAWVSPAGVVVRIAGGAFATALPMAAYLAWNAGPDAWQDLIVFPATDFKVVRGEGYPPLLPNWQAIEAWTRAPFNPEQMLSVSRYLSGWVQANVPQIAFVIGVVVLVRRWRLLRPDVVGCATVALLTMPLFWASAHIQQNTNFSTLWILCVLLGTLAWVDAGLRRPSRIALAALFVVGTGAFLVRPAAAIAEVAYFWPGYRRLDFPRVTGIRVPGPRYDILHPIVSFIREHVPESEPIYVGLARHDAVVISNQVFYFLSGRRVASRYNELHPGIVDLEATQREIIADLERLEVRCAVLWHFGWPRTYMDNLLAERRRELPEIGATVLDEYLRREFQEVARYGEYSLMWRKGGETPPPPK